MKEKVPPQSIDQQSFIDRVLPAEPTPKQLLEAIDAINMELQRVEVLLRSDRSYLLFTPEDRHKMAQEQLDREAYGWGQRSLPKGAKLENCNQEVVAEYERDSGNYEGLVAAYLRKLKKISDKLVQVAPGGELDPARKLVPIRRLKWEKNTKDLLFIAEVLCDGYINASVSEFLSHFIDKKGEPIMSDMSSLKWSSTTGLPDQLVNRLKTIHLKGQDPGADDPS